MSSGCFREVYRKSTDVFPTGWSDIETFASLLRAYKVSSKFLNRTHFD
jgi:hypothetical protein